MNKVEFVKALNELVLGLGDEDHLEYWFTCGVPDCPSQEDFEFIANDKDSFDETVNCFIRLSKHLKEGIEIDGKWYKGQIKV
jgi:hypothetical protein